MRPRAPASDGPRVPRGSSFSASGFPCASSSTRRRIAGVSPGALVSRRARRRRRGAAHGARGPSIPASASPPTHSRRATSMTMGSDSRRRATKPSTLRGRPVEPVGVLDDHEHRRRRREVTQEIEGREGDQEQVWHDIVDDPEGRQDGGALRLGEPVHPVHHRPQEMVETRERQVRLHRHPGRRQDPEAPGLGRGSCNAQQCRLADAGVAPRG